MAALPVVAWSAAAPSGSNRHVGREGTRAAWRRTCSRGDGGRRGNLPPKKMVRASHLLIKHAESRNPVSRRTNESTSGMSKEAARQAEWREGFWRACVNGLVLLLVLLVLLLVLLVLLVLFA